MAKDPALLWQLTNPGQTRVVRLDDEAMVFNPLTWETHLLASPATWVIEALASGAKPEADLAVGFADDDDRPEDIEASRTALRALLGELESLGLVTSKPEAR
jgi:PqqD family protein of HPr-rel-A system